MTVRVDPVPATASATSVQVLVVTSPANPSADGPATAAGGSEGTVENAGLGTSDTSRVVRPCRQQTLVNGEAIFTRLRLRATSYALGGRRFSLVVVLFDARGAVLSSIVSSPFLVHARIDGAPPRCRWSTPRTRRSSRSGAYNFSAFDVDTFSRVYVKKSSVKGNGAASTVEEVIDNSAVGLLRYFTAPNIRNKSRHPLLLVVRFSAALLLSRDVERYPVFDDDAATAFIAACGTVLPNAVDRDAGVPGWKRHRLCRGSSPFARPLVRLARQQVVVGRVAVGQVATMQTPPVLRRGLCCGCATCSATSAGRR